MSSSKNSKRSQGSSALERTRAVSDDDVESLIDRVTQGVLARLDKAVQESMGRHIQRPVSEIRSAVEDRVKAVEDTCKDLIQAIEFRKKEQREEIESLRLKVLELEHAAQ